MNGPGGEGRGGGDSTPEGRGGAGELTGRLLGGRYRVTGQIGRGGMGVVCRAVDEVLGREVAVKVLRAYTDASAPELADLRTRMQREARAAARVRHPGVVTVHDVIDEDGRPVIVMELVDGPSLDDALDRGGPMDPCEIAAIGAKVMDALDAAHQVGVLHRDVKPGNVLLERRPRRAGRPDTGVGRVVLTDFGIASIEAPDDGASTHLTRSGELVGSLDYLPPERAQGQPPSPASDIWSLGMTLYAAVEGSGAPFRRTSVWSTLTAIVSEPLPEPRRAGPLTPVLHALMAKDPAARPSAAEARALLTAVADGRDTVRLGSGTGAGAGIGTDTGAGTEPGTGTGTGADPGMSWTPTAADVRAASAPSPSGGQAPTGPLGGQSPTGPVIGQAPTGPASAVTPGERETSTVAAAGTAPPPSGRGRRTCVLATAVAAVLVAGGGVTYGLMARDSGGTVAERRPGAPSQEQAARAGASGTPEETGVVEPGDKATGKGESGRSAAPATSGEPSKSAASGKPKPGGGGDPGNGKGGDGGAAPGGTGGGGDGGAGAGGGGSAASGGGSATGGTGGAPEPSSCAPIGGGKVNCLVWRTAASYTGSFQHAGTLNAGTNYFYCQANLGRRETYGRWTNTWWAKTDDDSGNSGVYVSAVYLKGGRNDAPVPGLPTC